MKVVTFGELMLRLVPPGYNRFIQTHTYEASYGGGEANVAVSLANYGMDVTFVSKLPENEIGQAGVNSLRNYGVDTSMITRGGERTGIYFLEKGASQRPSKVIYDRAYSAISLAEANDFDWEAIFSDVDWFHFTGITPALSPTIAAICIQACEIAKKKKITISCDLNYRKKLWTREQARETMTKLMEYVDICIANEEDAYDVFGIQAKNTDITSGKVNHDGYKEVAEKLVKQFGLKYAAITLRESISASENNWAALLYDGKEHYISPRYEMKIVDRVGGGDSFGAGLIYALTHQFTEQEAVNFAVAASCLKHSVEGDYNLMNVNEVLTLVKGDGSGRVQR